MTGRMNPERTLLIGEAPITAGAPPFAPRTAARAALAALLQVEEDALDGIVTVRNALDTPQPRQGWGRAFDRYGARKKIEALKRGRVFAQRDVIFLSWRLARAARECLPQLPAERGRWVEYGRGSRLAWVRHPVYLAASLSEMRDDWRALGLSS
ncbi:hypothetical protein [Falsiroseomonas sp. HW251]|uniref:hypothetical protein n=1 Tax=Falsiroseomonas sp. HW251 TaxID=3390998 RepID=UPI003D3187D2